MPPDAPEIAVAFYFIRELGIWPYREPFMELPPALGGQLLFLLNQIIPNREASLADCQRSLAVLAAGR